LKGENQMDKKLSWGLFLFGIMIGMYTVLIIFAIFDVERPFRAMDLEPPQTVYEVEVDNLMFHCRERPRVITFAKLYLGDCAESYGRKIIIREYETYTVTVINN
jgi:hypothetical protein